MAWPARVKIVEVSPRDGLQNEARPVPTAVKIALVDRLAAAGVDTIEATSFVSPRFVPQMADAAQVMAGITPRPGVAYPVLVPNMQGFEAARAAGVREVALFTAASESFTKKNINCTIDESFARFAPVAQAAQQAGMRVRGYVSCALGCPYEGAVPAAAVARVAARLAALGCYEVSLGDTIGVGTPPKARAMVETVAREIEITRLAAHFHDTYGQALANLYAVLELGIAVVDASVAGLGGCPYAKGATGNVATEDVVYMLAGMGVETGVDLPALARVGAWISAELGRASMSRAGRATLARLGEGA